MKVGDRVTMPEHPFLSDGVIKCIHKTTFGTGKPFAYTVKLDEKAPNEYAWDTDEVLMFPSDIKLVN